MGNNGEFSKFISEFGSKEEEEQKQDEHVKEEDVDEKKDDLEEKRKEAVVGPGLMQVEERNTGAVSWDIYKAYSAAGKGHVVLPLLFGSLVLIQGATVMSSYWCVVLSWLAIGRCTQSRRRGRLVYWQEMYVFLMSNYAEFTDPLL